MLMGGGRIAEIAMSLLRSFLVTTALFAALPAYAAASPANPSATPPASDATLPAAAGEIAPRPPTAAPTISSGLVITLNTTGDFERKTLGYGCTGIEESLSVDYLNAAPNYLAMIPLDGSVLLFNTVLAGSGAKYVSGTYVWWTKGTDGSLYDLTEGPNAKPILTCSEVNNTP
jgi:membrane-bound inhibitor of C-type lysozyme